MALADLRTSLGMPQSASDFNALIAPYTDLAEKLQATTDSTNKAPFVYNNVTFSCYILQETSDGNRVWTNKCNLHIDPDNKILVLNSWDDQTTFLILFYADDKDYALILSPTTSYCKCLYEGVEQSVSITTPVIPTIACDTFSGYRYYTNDFVFKNVIRYITTPVNLFGVNIRTDTKDIMIINGISGKNPCGCLGIALDL